MTISITAVTPETVRIRYYDGKMWIDLEVPRTDLKGPPNKLGRFAQADVDWGFKAAPPPKPFEELTLAEIEAAALDFVQRALKKKSS